MVHAIEAYTSRHKKNPMSDQLARQALALLSQNIREVCRNGRNLEARSQMLLGSMLAGMAFANAPVAAVHALAYPIGAIFHVPHGLSNALVLMGVLRFNLPAAEALYAELAPIVDPEAAGLPVAEAAPRFVESLAAICRDCNVPASLAEVGVRESDLATLAEDAMKQTRLLVNNPREVTYADAYAIYSEALDGKRATGDGVSRAALSEAFRRKCHMNPFESMQALADLWGKGGQAMASACPARMLKAVADGMTQGLRQLARARHRRAS